VNHIKQNILLALKKFKRLLNY